MKVLLETLRISLAGLAVGVVGLGGCSDGGTDEHADHAHADDGNAVDDHGGAATDVVNRVDEYVGILGDVTFVPVAGDGKRLLKIRHMHIPNFKSEDGAVALSRDGYLGMKSMAMEFPVADGVSIEGLAAGDKIRFSFRVFWGERLGFEVTGIEKLDPGIEIDYSNAVP